MTRTARLFCLLFAALFVLSLPLLVPSGALLDEERNRMLEELPEESGWLYWLMPAARAEAPLAPLPMDLSPGRVPDQQAFTEAGYSDSSITLSLETLDKDHVVWRIARITVSDPSQLRTATAGKPGSNKLALISSMAQKNNAIIAINANYLSNDPVKTSFEYRMGEKIRTKYNSKKDLLITDELGDLHVFVKSQKDEVEAFQATGRQIINAFTFGPALVKDGQVLAMDPDYGYNPKGREPRMAIGQTGPLSYVLVLAEGRTKDSQGVTHQELADFMLSLGCTQAFNFDGGNSATMVYNGGYYQQKSRNNERAQSDMLYFATLAGPEGNP
ncbi:MAG: phosphodiester glycosidase family protein [Clostridiales bacterium]|nr:phosphodiester glycosidase family protein [Clostridiales bacterium]